MNRNKQTLLRNYHQIYQSLWKNVAREHFQDFRSTFKRNFEPNELLNFILDTSNIFLFHTYEICIQMHDARRPLYVSISTLHRVSSKLFSTFEMPKVEISRSNEITISTDYTFQRCIAAG